MDNPVDHPIDLGLVNYTKHPSNSDYVVFRFADKDRADSFEQALNEKKIWFERDQEQGRQRTFYLFGLHKSDFKVAQQLNYQVEGKHKKPLISFSPLRYFVVIFGLTMLTLAIVGYCKQQQKLASYDKNGTLINKANKNE